MTEPALFKSDEPTARVRISKVKYHDGRELSILPTPNNLDTDTVLFIDTLVRILAGARAGTVKCYVGAYMIEDADGRDRSVEFGNFIEGGYGLEAVGLLEGVKQRIMERLVADSGEIWCAPAS